MEESERPASALTDFKRLQSVGQSGQNEPESVATITLRFRKLTVSCLHFLYQPQFVEQLQLASLAVSLKLH